MRQTRDVDKLILLSSSRKSKRLVAGILNKLPHVMIPRFCVKWSINELCKLLIDIGIVFLFTCCKKKLSEKSHAASGALDVEPNEWHLFQVGLFKDEHPICATEP